MGERMLSAEQLHHDTATTNEGKERADARSADRRGEYSTEEWEYSTDARRQREARRAMK